MKLVDRHLGGEFLRLFALCVAAFLALFLVIDFFERLRFLLKYHAALGDAVLYFAARSPWMLAQALPMAGLLGTLLSAAVLARHGEITAFRCGGVSLHRLVLPYLAAGVLVSLATVLLQEVGVPRAAVFAREVEEVRIQKKPRRGLRKAADVWLRSGSRILHAEKVLPEEHRLVGVSVIELTAGRVARRIDAQEARWVGGRWVLRDVEDRAFDAAGFLTLRRFPEMAYPLGYGPEEFQVTKLNAEELPWPSLLRLIRRYRDQGLDTRELEAGLWAKTSVPFASIVMPLLAFPLALRSGRRGSSSAGIALGIALGFSYWLALAVGISLGKAGALPPALGAWIGNLLFGALGVVQLRRAERAA
ncbi:MAG: LPS export ABC transporter permease LptG [Deltaproteobacteria bacterium]|nr:LPS export ABC transporter permease LptG [Deltaproteobacteria bacterium]